MEININQLKQEIQEIKSANDFDSLRVKYLGGNGLIAQEFKKIKNLTIEEKKQRGKELNELKKQIETLFDVSRQQSACGGSDGGQAKHQFFDFTKPGIPPMVGHLHLITQAIDEITRIFEKIGFTRVRHPEIDSDYYAFESLNMPVNHPARDEWETFFVATKNALRMPKATEEPLQDENNVRIVLTPHTSNGQVREMEKGQLPIRMINIAKCYRRQSDISHTPMFHQFEGLYVDKKVSIKHLIGVIDYFGKQFFGEKTKSRIRPFHFKFTEPSFEVDFSCSWCGGKGCRLCKEGWLELGGAGMVHPNVLRAGGIDPNKYSGFAFGWGVERTYMIKCGFLSDLRTMYSTDLRVLRQF